jgi:hypothetical protein
LRYVRTIRQHDGIVPPGTVVLILKTIVGAARCYGASATPVSLVANEDAKLLKVSGFPVAKVGFLDRHARANPPAKFGVVGKPNVEIQEAFLKSVFDPVHDLPT